MDFLSSLVSIRFGDFVDVSEGPHIPRTSFCFQYEITAAHILQTSQSELIRRFQGVSLPIHLRVTTFFFCIYFSSFSTFLLLFKVRAFGVFSDLYFILVIIQRQEEFE